MESMVCSDRKLAHAVGAKSARACDNCIKKRARWYCAADDAFLCQTCDSSVHSANPLARRHERVRLKTSSSSSIKSPDDEEDESRRPTWHRGFTRKARTPRHKKKNRPSFNCEPVPEINCSEENSHDENDEQLLYRVPIFDPFVAELCTPANSNDVVSDSRLAMSDFNMNHFLPTEMDLAEFATDVESLLGNGLENEAFDMEGLGILECDEEREKGSRVKVEDEEAGEVIDNNNNHQEEAAGGEFIDMGRESFVLNFDYDSPMILGELGEDNYKGFKSENRVVVNNNNHNNDKVCDDSRKIFLRLDYDGVMSAWDDQKSPWTTGERPDLDSRDCWPDCVGTCGTMHGYGEMGMMSTHASVMADGGREARVSRYREKRRTRLFSKKIRYEVRKLNAEKRPRMKGRFVKRANFVAAPAFTFAQ
ncbi:zinc finger protein constans-like 16 [Phtheirospermum japonicum]|uniref:Zinc finger protein constans-like 16 n=1 Tax=Phtheirospermum japonicum TaxID=374723 RepID=A0A830BEH5_9LAMI|nr:zinc finger protein constans-like 16 [Phtheirospermum japonicum]